MVNPKRAIRKAPLLVVGSILTRSFGVVLSDSLRSKSSDSKSVKSLVFLIGTVPRAFLIQKTSMSGQTEKPIKSQPRELWMNSKVTPPARKAKVRV